MLTTMPNLTEHRPGLGESHHYSQYMRDIQASFCTLGPGIKTACLAATPSLSEVMYEHNVSLAIYPMPRRNKLSILNVIEYCLEQLKLSQPSLDQRIEFKSNICSFIILVMVESYIIKFYQ